MYISNENPTLVDVPAFAGVLHRQLRSMPIGEEPQQGWRFYEAGEHEFDFLCYYAEI